MTCSSCTVHQKRNPTPNGKDPVPGAKDCHGNGGEMTAGRRRIKVSLVILGLVINAIRYRLLMNSTKIIVA